MKIIVAGSSGFVGAALVSFWQHQGHQIMRLVRSEKTVGSLQSAWDPEKGIIHPEDLEGCDAVVNLSGENVSSGRWTQKKKQRLYDSRIKTTKLLCQTLAKLKKGPKVLLNASAIGYYGRHCEQTKTESAPNGEGFLANICVDWEAATKEAEEAGIRVVKVRTAIVLDPKGGVLKKLLLPFKLCLGGTLGNGKQMMSWISLHELCRIYDFCLTKSDLKGAVNASSPEPVSNAEFTKTLGAVLNRPTLFPVPEFALKLIFGEMADELLLSSCAALPQKLEKAGFQFQDGDLKSALLNMQL